MKLPADVQRYLAAKLPGIDWDALDQVTGDLCQDCPQHPRQDPDDDDPICLSCPWFGYLYGKLQAKHWRPRRRPGRKSE